MGYRSVFKKVEGGYSEEPQYSDRSGAELKIKQLLCGAGNASKRKKFIKRVWKASTVAEIDRIMVEVRRAV